ncbi:hypothetical protein RIF29_18063 [Crotalaria pallida]|uniref:Uncharacterized protein n=1 Tax=Crotalaria pallida TaxID=3830 RepID=A0AAN9FIE4_CROPI
MALPLQPGSDIGSRLHLSVVLSYGNVLKDDDLKYSVTKRADKKNSYLSTLFPLQSYAMKGGIPRKDVRTISYGPQHKGKQETADEKLCWKTSPICKSNPRKKTIRRKIHLLLLPSSYGWCIDENNQHNSPRP